jgi:hypothetical protein
VGEAARDLIESTRVAVTGSAFVPLRIVTLLAIVAAVVTIAPFPFSVVGIVAWLLIALHLGRTMR